MPTQYDLSLSNVPREEEEKGTKGDKEEETVIGDKRTVKENDTQKETQKETETETQEEKGTGGTAYAVPPGTRLKCPECDHEYASQGIEKSENVRCSKCKSRKIEPVGRVTPTETAPEGDPDPDTPTGDGIPKKRLKRPSPGTAPSVKGPAPGGSPGGFTFDPVGDLNTVEAMQDKIAHDPTGFLDREFMTDLHLIIQRLIAVLSEAPKRFEDGNRSVAEAQARMLEKIISKYIDLEEHEDKMLIGFYLSTWGLWIAEIQLVLYTENDKRWNKIVGTEGKR